MNELGYTIPEEYWTNDRLLLRILAGEKYSHAKTLHHIIEHSTWLRETYPIAHGPLAQMLQSGFLYVCGRDVKFRPIVILNVRKMVEVEPEID